MLLQRHGFNNGHPQDRMNTIQKGINNITVYKGLVYKHQISAAKARIRSIESHIH
jgi:hypothetical protein